MTAEKRSAEPLAQVAFRLLDNVDAFPEIFFARLVQRVGGWPIPLIVPRTDHNDAQWETERARWKAMGYRKSAVNDDVEGAAEYTIRVAGVMRVYFHILQIRPTQKPLKPMFQAHRLWVWVARLMSKKALLESVVAAQLLYSKCCPLLLSYHLSTDGVSVSCAGRVRILCKARLRASVEQDAGTHL